MSSTTTRSAEPPYFATTPAKFVVLSGLTFGGYLFYWAYRNWVREARRSPTRIRPLWRALTLPVTAYALLRRIKNFGLAAGVPTSFSPGLLALSHAALVGLTLISPLGWLALPLSCLPLLPARSASERINRAALGGPGGGSVQ